MGEIDLGNLERRLEPLKNRLVEAFDEHCRNGLHTLKNHLLHHMADEIRVYGTLSVLNRNAYEHYNL